MAGLLLEYRRVVVGLLVALLATFFLTHLPNDVSLYLLLGLALCVAVLGYARGGARPWECNDEPL